MSRRIAPIAVLIFVLAGGIAAAGTPAAPPGALDTSFSDDGVARLPAPSQLLGAAVQADDKLVAAGQSHGKVAVVRFNGNGSLDHSFNGDGIYICNRPRKVCNGPKDAGHGVAIDSSGRILVAATSSQGGMTAIRLMPNGKPDSSFSGDGIAVAGRLLPGGEGLDLALQGNTVVVAGRADIPGGKGVAVARFTDTGVLDDRFLSGGAQIYGYGVSSANAVAIDGDGRIVLAGSQTIPGGANQFGGGKLVLAARLYRNGKPDDGKNPDDGNGTPDPGFGNTGVPGLFLGAYQRSAPYSAAFDVRVDDKNRPVLAGVALDGRPYTTSMSGADAIAVRLTAAGMPDPEFADNGVAYQAATASKYYSKPEPYPGAYGVTLGDSDIIIGGYFDEFGRKRLALWALDQSGHPDPNFGFSFQGFGNESGKANALAIAGDGDLFAVGDLSGSSVAGLAVKYSDVGAPPRVPASTILTPSTAENPIRIADCLTAKVGDQYGAALSEIEVLFRVEGVNSSDEFPLVGSPLTDENGEARFCYIGQVVGDDTIRAGPGVRLASASKKWGKAESLPEPELGESVNAAPTGTVLVSPPDGGAPVPIKLVSHLPVDSLIDATRGRVQLTSAPTKKGDPQTTDLSGGRFRVRQMTHTGLTVIRLVGGAPRSCPGARSGKGASRARRHRARKPLVADGENTRTSGDNGSATTSSVPTRWLTQNRCDGTFFKVTRGVAVVRDFTRHRKIVLHAGEHYRAPGHRARRGASRDVAKAPVP